MTEIKDQEKALSIIRWASGLKQGQEDVDYNELAISCAELSDVARTFLENEGMVYTNK